MHFRFVDKKLSIDFITNFTVNLSAKNKIYAFLSTFRKQCVSSKSFPLLMNCCNFFVSEHLMVKYNRFCISTAIFFDLTSITFLMHHKSYHFQLWDQCTIPQDIPTWIPKLEIQKQEERLIKIFFIY